MTIIPETLFHGKTSTTDVKEKEEYPQTSYSETNNYFCNLLTLKEGDDI